MSDPLTKEERYNFLLPSPGHPPDESFRRVARRYEDTLLALEATVEAQKAEKARIWDALVEMAKYACS